MYNMAIVKNTAKRWGHSLGVIIPSEIAKKIELKEGQTLEIDIRIKKGIDAFGRFKGANSFKEEKPKHKRFW